MSRAIQLVQEPATDRGLPLAGRVAAGVMHEAVEQNERVDFADMFGKKNMFALEVLFNDVSAQASWTKPAVASIMTSRHPSGHDTTSKIAVLPEELPTIASELQKSGVRTAAVVTNYNFVSYWKVFGRW